MSNHESTTAKCEAEPILGLEGLDEDVAKVLRQLMLKEDPAFKGSMVQRDLSKLTVSEAVELLEMLRKAAEFGKEPPSPANVLARKLFAVIEEGVRKVSPEIVRLMEAEHSLAMARDAAQKVYEQYLNEKSRFGRPLVYWGAAIALYLVSIAVGGLVMALVGGAFALWAFGRSTLCRTSRAVVYWRVGEFLGSLSSTGRRAGQDRRQGHAEKEK
jgi:hypothetical protein